MQPESLSIPASTTTKEPPQQTPKQGRITRGKHWEYYPKVKGFVEQPVEILEGRTRQPQVQATAAVTQLSTRPYEAAVHPSKLYSGVDTEVAPRVVTMSPHRYPPHTADGPKLLLREPKQIFNHAVTQFVVAYNAVHLEVEESLSLGAPVAPFEEAMQEDAPGWKAAINTELRALVDMSTFKIM